MEIKTVCENLKNTIAGKEKYLSQLEQKINSNMTDMTYMAIRASADFLKINIEELKRILQDLEMCNG